MKFQFHSVIKQLTVLLSHPDIVNAICKHKAHLHRPNHSTDMKEDVQHGHMWSQIRGLNGHPFFTPDGDEIGLILTLDWYVVRLRLVN
jgi:hypothetical protein